jgi:hypothetical protein
MNGKLLHCLLKPGRLPGQWDTKTQGRGGKIPRVAASECLRVWKVPQSRQGPSKNVPCANDVSMTCMAAGQTKGQGDAGVVPTVAVFFMHRSAIGTSSGR